VSDLGEMSNLRRTGYMIQLDALRGLAVFGVLIEHFLPSTFFIHKLISWGGVGVSLFFVLSGYLITGILMRYRSIAN
jgi:peptidoglycan/LPS O-acetylase OafA/YrhL